MRMLLFLGSAGLASTALAADLYVDAAQSDGDCLSAGTACSTLEEALSVAGSGDTVHIASGTYSDTASAYPLDVPSGVSLLGAGATNTVIVPNSATDIAAALRYTNQRGSVALQGVTVRDAHGHGILVSGTTGSGTFTLSDVTSQDNNASQLHIDGVGYDVSVAATGCTFDHGQHGVRAAMQFAALDLTLTGSTLSGNLQGITVTRSGSTSVASQPAPALALTLIDNEVNDNLNGGIDVRGGFQGWTALLLSDNTVSGNSGEASVRLEGQSSGRLYAQMVDNTLVGGGSNLGLWMYGGPNNDMKLALSGGSIIGHDQYGVRWYADTHGTADVSLRNVALSGNGSDGLHLSSGSSNQQVWRIEGVTLADNGGRAFHGALGYGGQKDITLHDNTVFGNDGSSGVALYAPSTGSMKLTVTENEVDATDSPGGAGMRLSFPGYGKAECAISGNTITNAAGPGLAMQGYSGVDATLTVVDNTLTGNGSHGILVHGVYYGTADLAVTGNTVRGNGDNAVNIQGGSGNTWDITLADNTLDGGDVGSRGIYVRGNYNDIDLDISGGSIVGHLGNGIQVDASTYTVIDAHVSGITISRNDGDGMELGWGTGNHVRLSVVDATIEDNGGSALDVSLGNNQLVEVSLAGSTIVGNEKTALMFQGASTATAAIDLVDNAIDVEGAAGADGLLARVGLGSSADVSLRGNTITGADGQGVQVENSSSGVVSLLLEDNTLTGNAGGGLWANAAGWGAFDVRLAGNTFAENDAYGAWLGTPGSDNHLTVDLLHNAITDNTGTGIGLSGTMGGALVADLYGNVVRDNTGDGLYVAFFGSDLFSIDLDHNTIDHNDDGYASNSYYDVHLSGASGHDVTAWDNWWGTTDTTLIADHVFDGADTSFSARVRFTALDTTLAFTLASATGPVAGGTAVAIQALEDAPRFMPPAGRLLPTVTFGGDPSPQVAVSDDGRWIFADLPPHAAGLVDVTVTNPGGQSGTLSQSFAYLAPFVDADEDGVEDGVDNCPGVANTDQVNHDDDPDGDACDTDDDDDTVLDASDNCPTVANTAQDDLDLDGDGDACDPDDDGDEVDDIEDNCPGIANPTQDDLDGDDIGDACDLDADGDGIADADETEDCEEDDDDDTDEGTDADQGCGCATGPAPTGGALTLFLALFGMCRRRRGPAAP